MGIRRAMRGDVGSDVRQDQWESGMLVFCCLLPRLYLNPTRACPEWMNLIWPRGSLDGSQGKSGVRKGE
jgi:hypothetical protein